jgi:hypothetical protein
MAAPAVLAADDAASTDDTDFVPVAEAPAAAEPTRRVADASLLFAIAAVQVAWLAFLAFGLYVLAT